MIHDRIKPHDGSNEYCFRCERQIDHCICWADEEEQNNLGGDSQLGESAKAESGRKLAAQNNLPAVPVLAKPPEADSPTQKRGQDEGGEAREVTDSPTNANPVGTRGGGQTPSDDWEPIAAQLDYWRDMDLQYWEQRKEREYSAWLDRRIKSRIKGAK